MTKDWWEQVFRCRDAKEFGKVLADWFRRHDTPDLNEAPGGHDPAKTGLKPNGSR